MFPKNTKFIFRTIAGRMILTQREGTAAPKTAAFTGLVFNYYYLSHSKLRNVKKINKNTLLFDSLISDKNSHEL